MPWSERDVDRFKKGLSKKQKKLWVKIANAVLETYLARGYDREKAEELAIRTANSRVGDGADGSMGGSGQEWTTRSPSEVALDRESGYRDGPRPLILHDRLRVDTVLLDGSRALYRQDVGTLIAPVVLAQEGVQPYVHADGSITFEYKPAEELRKAVDSLRGVPITDRHPVGGVVAPHDTALKKGMIGEDVEFRDGKIQATEYIIDDALIQDILSGRKRQVSIGFRADVIERDGVFRGQRYNRVQTNIRVNHVAHLEKGRCGPTCQTKLDAGTDLWDAAGWSLPCGAAGGGLPCTLSRMDSFQGDGVVADCADCFGGVQGCPALSRNRTNGECSCPAENRANGDHLSMEVCCMNAQQEKLSAMKHANDQEPEEKKPEVKVVPEPEAEKCPHCGAVLTEEAYAKKVCLECKQLLGNLGKNSEEEEEEETKEEAQDVTAQAQKVEKEPEEEEEEKRKRKPRTLRYRIGASALNWVASLSGTAALTLTILRGS